MILGHLTSTYVLAKKIPKKITNIQLALILFGAYLPDCIDKSLMLLELGAGRGIGHSLVFNLPTLVVAFALSRNEKLKPYAIAIVYLGVGQLLHLLGDLIDVKILLWPLLGDLPSFHKTSLLNTITTFYQGKGNFSTFILEMISHFSFIYILVKDYISHKYSLSE